MDLETCDEVPLADLFEKFVEATTMRNILAIHSKILNQAGLKPCEFSVFFSSFKKAILSSRQRKNWKAKALFSKIDKRAAHKCYSNTKVAPSKNESCDNSTSERTSDNDDTRSQSDDNYISNNNALMDYNCLVIGSGPAGLRTAIELQLLGAKRVVIAEKRGRFSRNNVLHLWPFVIDDLKSLGAKKFYGKFCAGSIDHVSIRQLQLMLLKVCLMIGCDFRDSCSYIDLCPASLGQMNSPLAKTKDDKVVDSECKYESCPAYQKFMNKLNNQSVVNSGDIELDPEDKMKIKSETLSEDDKGKRIFNLKGVEAHFECDNKKQETDLQSIRWDIIVGADGRRNTLSRFFPRIEFRGRLAIAITANFINRQTPAETSVPEISGLSFIYNQDMFNALAYDTNIELENICYYKDDTHYFVMTAKKRSLLERGVLIEDYAVTKDLLSDSNIDRKALLKYAKDAAFWTTGLEPLDFALNHYGKEDCAMFDFTSMYAASHACKALRTRNGGLVLLSLVGDSLLEPFWPTGSGCARGFLSSFDAAWMCRQWAVNKCAVIENRDIATRGSSKYLNNHLKESGKSTLEPTTYDRMAMNVLAERESIYRILAQTTSENLQQNFSHWTLNPHTRYPNLNRHLVAPVQVEHLVVSDQKRNNIDGKPMRSNKLSSMGRRIKSPNKHNNLRRSPKKLKSAGASPTSQPKHHKNHYKSLSKLTHQSKSRNDVTVDDYYLEFEQSYKDLDDFEKGGTTQYLNYKQRNSLDIEHLLNSSASGTLLSSNNLSKLEARKARDIDECLRQRRQKSKIHIVRDQLISQMRGEKDFNGKPILTSGNAVLFNEVKRMREQLSRGVRADSKSKEVSNGPLSLLNSMRRCASFAERVQSFESKLGKFTNETTKSIPSTPKTPIDNVKNLPQFATLQELIINNGQSTTEQHNKKPHSPVFKLSKDDWNVKCWEKRLSAHKQSGLSLSSRSLNKALSADNGKEQAFRVPESKVKAAVFQDRIKEMASKLKSDKENNHCLDLKSTKKTDGLKSAKFVQTKSNSNNPVRSQGWINHLKRELSKGSDEGKRTINGQYMNPSLPSRPIKKLFEDEDQDDDLDANKHFDHLCINRPTNKYLAKGSYTSHMARVKYNATNSRVIDRPKPTSKDRHVHPAAQTSRGSSVSSTLSDFSTATANSSSGSTKYASTHSSVTDVECSRCLKFVSTAERICIGSSSFHRNCLSCSSCGLTLRTNEIKHYLNSVVLHGNNQDKKQVAFLCSMCEPGIENTSVPLKSGADNLHKDVGADSCSKSIQTRLISREEFLSAKIDYDDIYKNILADRKSTDNKTFVDDTAQRPSLISPSPVQVILPMNLISESTGNIEDNEAHEIRDANSLTEPHFNVASSRTIDGSEQVTLVLPSNGVEEDLESPQVVSDETTRFTRLDTNRERRASRESDMIDEEKLNQILHLDVSHSPRRLSETSSSKGGSSQIDNESISSVSLCDDDNQLDQQQNTTESSSLEQNLEASSDTDNYESPLTNDDNPSSLDLSSDSD